MLGKRSLKRKQKWLIVLTTIHLLLFICSLICFVGTSKNNKIINSIGCELSYSEAENGRVELTFDTGKEVVLQFGKDSVKVVNSYTAKSRKESLFLAIFIRSYASENGYTVTRKVTEIYGEYRLHNVLYGLGIAKEHTADSDLDYEKDRRWYINALANFIGWMGF